MAANSVQGSGGMPVKIAWGDDGDPPSVRLSRKRFLISPAAPKDATYVGIVHKCDTFAEAFFIELDTAGYSCQDLLDGKSTVVLKGPGVEFRCLIEGTFKVYVSTVGRYERKMFTLVREHSADQECCEKPPNLGAKKV